ncbi:MAG: TIGR01459 family HAD-type hydrolase, partial [Mesorhizobium sp.]
MADTPDIITSLDALARRYAAILCDVWGVVHNGEWHFPAAAA